VFDIQKLIEKYTDELSKIQNEHKNTLLKFGSSDSAMESRFPTGRTELETTLKVIEDKLADLTQKIEHLLDLQSKKQHQTDTVTEQSAVKLMLDGSEGWYLINSAISDYSNGVISIDTTLGKHLLKSKIGEKHVGNGDETLVVHIKDVIALVD
jgi:transcription elongation GreA/GreB family factor